MQLQICHSQYRAKRYIYIYIMGIYIQRDNIAIFIKFSITALLNFVVISWINI